MARTATFEVAHGRSTRSAAAISLGGRLNARVFVGGIALAALVGCSEPKFLEYTSGPMKTTNCLTVRGSSGYPDIAVVDVGSSVFTVEDAYGYCWGATRHDDFSVRTANFKTFSGNRLYLCSSDGECRKISNAVLKESK